MWSSVKEITLILGHAVERTEMKKVSNLPGLVYLQTPV